MDAFSRRRFIIVVIVPYRTMNEKRDLTGVASLLKSAAWNVSDPAVGYFGHPIRGCDDSVHDS